jgi:MarR family transcriptional regulator, 2-MHQ and catechol-resistance regulon repressor
LIVNILTFGEGRAMRDGAASDGEERSFGPSDADVLLVYNLLRTESSLGPFIDRGLRELRLTGTQLNALLVLRAAGADGLSLGELGRRLVVTKANVTGLIDRLERDALVQRDSHSDRRVTLARLTAKGAQLLEEALPRHLRLLAGLLECLAPEEKEQLIALLTKLRQGLRAKQGP